MWYIIILLNCLQTLEYLLCHTAIHHTKLVINCLWQCKTLFRVLHMQHYCKATNCKFIVASMPKLPEQSQYSKNVDLFDKFISFCRII